MAAVTGISEHSGWAEFVTVAVRDDGRPVIADRRRCELVARDLPQNPYHHEGLQLPLAQAEELVARVRRSVTEHVRIALTELQSSFSVGAVALQDSPFDDLPDSLAEVLKSYSLTCAADGMMYREALADGAAALGLAVDRYPRKSDEAAAAAEALGVTRERAASIVAEFGRVVGPPWRKEHQQAAASALRVLAMRGKLRL